MASPEIGLALCMDSSIFVPNHQGDVGCEAGLDLGVGKVCQGNHASGG